MTGIVDAIAACDHPDNALLLQDCSGIKRSLLLDEAGRQQGSAQPG
ncbi:MAG TPA: hypothetical protein P5234_13535 [Thermoanaerobaculaceae bacterium]|nr:hypothetical protein [Thermoanaerobaculaceae bacterium]HRS17253.1 hypothetical protein [Thermoanaerobaculaceae bacterium]